MKVIIPNPPEGYEAEAEIRKIKKGEFYIYDLSEIKVLQWLTSDESFDFHVVLTPKKPERWRAEPGCDYWTISDLAPFCPAKKTERGCAFCDQDYRHGYYFRTEAQAIEMANRLRATVDAFHAENAREEGR